MVICGISLMRLNFQKVKKQSEGIDFMHGLC